VKLNRAAPRDVRVSVIVPTHNRAANLARLVSALAAQDFSGAFEVVIVDDASSDRTAAVIDELAVTGRLSVVSTRLPHNSGPATARNAGVGLAAGELIAFIDDDCVPMAGWLDALVRGFESADVVQGKTIADPALADRIGPFSRTMEVSGENGIYATCNVAYRRSLLAQLGGFDERLRVAEDIDMGIRARRSGARTLFVADAVVAHDVRHAGFAEHLRELRNRTNIPLTVRMHPEARAFFYRGIFFRDYHAAIPVAVAGLVVTCLPQSPASARLAGVALLAPWVRRRFRTLRGSRLRRVAALPALFVYDAADVAVLAIGSARHRALVL